jgi:hypothetical protein
MEYFPDDLWARQKGGGARVENGGLDITSYLVRVESYVMWG